MLQLCFSITLFGFMLYLLWEATLISSLAERNIILPFTGLESLMLKTDYKIVVAPSTAQVGSFKFSGVPLWQKAWSERIEPYYNFYAEYSSTVNGCELKTCLFYLSLNELEFFTTFL